MKAHWQQENKTGHIEYNLSAAGKGIAALSHNDSEPKNQYILEIYLTIPITRKAILADSFSQAQEMAIVIIKDIVREQCINLHQVINAVWGC